MSNQSEFHRIHYPHDISDLAERDEYLDDRERRRYGAHRGPFVLLRPCRVCETDFIGKEPAVPMLFGGVVGFYALCKSCTEHYMACPECGLWDDMRDGRLCVACGWRDTHYPPQET